jgi:hypothetical protein
MFMWTALVSLSLEKRMSMVASVRVERRMSNFLACLRSPGLGFGVAWKKINQSIFFS